MRIALCQILCLDGDREGNFRRIEYALEEAREGGARLACFPESCLLGWENPQAHRRAEPIPGKDTERIAELARRHGLWIAMGLDEKDGDRLYDSAVLVDPGGALRLRHRKIDVFPELMDPPYAAGRPEDIAAADTELGRIGLLICADTFAADHLARAAAGKPDLLVVPYGWAAPPEDWPEHAEELVELVRRVARTIGCAVVGTDLVGQITHGPWAGRTYGGRSVAADRDGNVLALGRDRDADVVVVDVPLGR